jgi:hypothetical protein
VTVISYVQNDSGINQAKQDVADSNSLVSAVFLPSPLSFLYEERCDCPRLRRGTQRDESMIHLLNTDFLVFVLSRRVFRRCCRIRVALPDADKKKQPEISGSFLALTFLAQYIYKSVTIGESGIHRFE